MEEVIVYEGNSPRLTFQFKRRKPDGGFEPYALDTADDIHFYAKDSKADPDNTAKIHYSVLGGEISISEDGTAPNAEYSEIFVQTEGTDMTPPGGYFLHIDVEVSSRMETVMDTILEIRDL